MPKKTINDFLPEADVLLDLEPEELAGSLLEFLKYEFAFASANRMNSPNRQNVIQIGAFRSYLPNFQEKIAEAVAEAWAWLESAGLIAIKPYESGESVFITRRGQKLSDRDSFEIYRKASLLPKGLLHPAIASKVYPAFLRGEYDTAVFQAFREVEVAVRAKGNFAPTVLGKDLMNQAFNPNKSGVLCDTTAPTAEQEGLYFLFAGTIAYFRNPVGHRNVNLLPEEAVEMILFASHLLRIVDSRP